MNFAWKRRLIFSGLILTGWVNAQTVARPSDYFQQEVAYRIDVSLNDSTHTLSAHLELDYTNNSPDTLEFIWFHLWPNGYKNRETAFAKQQFGYGSTKFYFAKDEERGYIDSLDFRVGAVHLEWDFHPEWIDVARVNLDQALPPGGSVTIETPFFVKIPKIFSRLGHTGNHYEISQWYPKPAVYDRDGWHPMPYLEMGEYYSEFGTFDVHITLPSEYVIMATGDLPEGDPEYVFLDSLVAVTAEYYALKTDDDEPDKKARKKWLKEINKREFSEPGDSATKTLHFHQERVHDFAWFADKRYLVQKGALWVDDSTRAITIWALYLPKYADIWEQSIEYIHDAADWAGRIYGTYPYNHVSAASSDKSAGGAMEYPNITIISIAGNKELLEAAIMHEVTHNWHYGIYGYNERDYTWLDEGLTNYSETPYWHNKYDTENGGRFLSGLPKGLDRLMSRPFTMRSLKHSMANIVASTGDDVPIDGDFSKGSLLSYGMAIQSRAPVVFDFMEHYLGPERHRALWDEFAPTWFFGHPGPAELRAAYETAAGEDLSWFFDDLIGSTKRLDYGVSDLAFRGSEVEVTVTNFGEIQAPVEVATLNKHGEVLSSQWLPGFSGSQAVTFSGEGVNSATTDPGMYAPDFKRSNDHLPLFHVADVDFQRPALRFLLSATEPDRTRLFFAPAFWASKYNGFTPGLVFYHGIAPPVKNRFYNALLYDFHNERPVGRTALTLKRYRVLGTDELSGNLAYTDYQGRNETKVTLQAKFRERAVAAPYWRMTLQAARQSLKPAAFDTLYWDPGRINSTSLEAYYNDNTLNIWQYWLSGQARLVSGSLEGISGTVSGATAELEGHLQYKLGYKKYLQVRGWAGSILSGQNELPRQYKFWLSGGLDPEFSNITVANRTGAGAITAYDRYYIQEGPGLRSPNFTAPGSQAWGVNLSLEGVLPGPLDAFVDLAGTEPVGDGIVQWETYFDTGLTISLGPFTIILPLYDNWSVGNARQLKNRWRLTFELPKSPL